jgi:hypothetical protein
VVRCHVDGTTLQDFKNRGAESALARTPSFWQRLYRSLLAHRAISLLCSNYGAFGVKRTSPHDAISLGPASLASFPTMCSGKTGT